MRAGSNSKTSSRTSDHGRKAKRSTATPTRPATTNPATVDGPRGKSREKTKDLVSLAVIAELLNLGERRVQQLAKEGLPRANRGVYDREACIRFYIRYLQRKLIERALPEDGDGDGGGPATSASATRHKMLSIESELKQIELAEKREQLVSIEKVQKDLEAIVAEIRTRILALPPRLAAEVLGETDLAVSQVKIDRSLKGALDVLSQFDPDVS